MFNANSPIAIVGASGRVASRVIPILDRKFSLRLGDLRGPLSEAPPVHAIDLLAPESLTPFLAGAATVIHFAIASYEGSAKSAAHKEAYHQQMLKVNIAGTYNLLEAARIAGVSRVIYISSLTVAMGAATDLAETLAPCPIDTYACTKLFGENMTELYHRTYGMKGISLRLGQPFPLGLPQEDTLRRDPACAHTFVTIADIARAIEAAITTDREDYGVYNVVSPSRGDRISYAKGLEIGFKPLDHWQDCDESNS